MKTRSRRLWLALMVGVVLAWFLRGTLLTAAGTYLVHAEAPRKSDFVVVLAGDGYGERIITAANLVRDGFAPKVLVSGPGGNYGSHECDLAIPFAIRAGYPEAYFLHAEHDAHSTQEEAEDLRPMLEQLHAHRVLLVTSNFHTRRSGRIFRAVFPDMEITVVAAPSKEFTPDRWWKSREGQKIALQEWVKTVTQWFGV